MYFMSVARVRWYCFIGEKLRAVYLYIHFGQIENIILLPFVCARVGNNENIEIQ